MNQQWRERAAIIGYFVALSLVVALVASSLITGKKVEIDYPLYPIIGGLLALPVSYLIERRSRKNGES